MIPDLATGRGEPYCLGMRSGPRPSNTLLGISEVHDLSFTYQAGPLLRLLEGEGDLLPDLLHARPWLAELDRHGAQRVLETLLEQEWSGFLARLGRLGPWVFSPTVADLQALSGAYTSVVEAASGSDLHGCAASSLLGRLWASGNLNGRAGPEQAELAERAFWTLAQARAMRQSADWAARKW